MIYTMRVLSYHIRSVVAFRHYSRLFLMNLWLENRPKSAYAYPGLCISSQAGTAVCSASTLAVKSDADLAERGRMTQGTSDTSVAIGDDNTSGRCHIVAVIDAGGTKCTVILASKQGILARSQSGPCN